MSGQNALQAWAEEALDVLRWATDERHGQRTGSGLCDWCGMRWPCEAELARQRNGAGA